MKLRIMSDLHIEFADWTPPPSDADVVVLAGDINIKGRGITWALKNFSVPVIFVAGNHDYYKGSLGHTCQKMAEQAQGSNVHFLHNGAVVLDGVRFVGGTLWTDYRLTGNEPLAQWDALQTMSDFKAIRNEKFSKIRPQHLASAHFKTKAFLEQQFAEPFAGKTVVVTHHAPCEMSIAEEYLRAGGHLSASYASRLDHMMGDHAKLWIHGHTHDSFDYDIYGTRVICNPRGYAPDDLNPDFKDNLIVEI